MSQKVQPTLVEVQQLFEEWRRGKKRRERIPAALWEAAVSLSRHLSADRRNLEPLKKSHVEENFSILHLSI